MLTIDSRLLEADGEMNHTENYNRLLVLIDSLTTTVADLTERVVALETPQGGS